MVDKIRLKQGKDKIKKIEFEIKSIGNFKNHLSLNRFIKMNIYNELLKEHSKAQTMRIVNYVNSDKNKFAELMQLFLGNNYRTAQRASWAVNYCAQNHPHLITPYLKKMIAQMDDKTIHVAVKRNTVRMLQFIKIPESIMGKAVSACFNFLNDATETVAVKAFSMTVILNCCQQYPELKEELASSIIAQMQLPSATAGIKARGKAVLKQLQK